MLIFRRPRLKAAVNAYVLGDSVTDRKEARVASEEKFPHSWEPSRSSHSLSAMLTSLTVVESPFPAGIRVFLAFSLQAAPISEVNENYMIYSIYEKHYERYITRMYYNLYVISKLRNYGLLLAVNHAIKGNLCIQDTHHNINVTAMEREVSRRTPTKMQLYVIQLRIRI